MKGQIAGVYLVLLVTGAAADTTGPCARLDFGESLAGTDSTVSLTILLTENEPLRAFQFVIVDNSNDALVLKSVEAGKEVEGWTIPAVETGNGTGLILGFSLSGDETHTGEWDTLVTVTFHITGPLGDSLSFHLDDSRGVLLSDAKAQNVACSYPNSENPIVYSTDWLATDEEDPGLPDSYLLGQNFPNPFNPMTTIRFDLPSTGFVRVSVYNLLGQEVATLVNGVLSSGRHEITWNGRNGEGHQVATGVYLYALTADNFTAHKKMVLLR